MTELKFIIILNFADEIKESEAGIVANNIKDALIHQANTAGITPEDSDAFTTEISIIHPDFNIEIFEKLYPAPR